MRASRAFPFPVEKLTLEGEVWSSSFSLRELLLELQTPMAPSGLTAPFAKRLWKSARQHDFYNGYSLMPALRLTIACNGAREADFTWLRLSLRSYHKPGFSPWRGRSREKGFYRFVGNGPSGDDFVGSSGWPGRVLARFLWRGSNATLVFNLILPASC